MLRLIYGNQHDNDDDFFSFDSLRPINTLSVKQGQVFLG